MASAAGRARLMRRLGSTLLLVVTVAGCSRSYTGERLFWHAQRPLQQVIQAPDDATPEQIAEAVDALERVMLKAPGTASAVRAQLSIGFLYAQLGDMTRARAAYQRVSWNHAQYHTADIAARVAVAKTYEAEENWSDAATVYSELADRFPWSWAGLGAPLRVAELQAHQSIDVEPSFAYARALRAYRRLHAKAPTPLLAEKVTEYLAKVRSRLE